MPYFESTRRRENRIVQVNWKTYHQSRVVEKNLYNSVCKQKRRKLVDFAREISVAKQAELLGVNRTTLYYKPKITSEEYLKINRLIDKIYTAYPFSDKENKIY